MQTGFSRSPRPGPALPAAFLWAGALAACGAGALDVGAEAGWTEVASLPAPTSNNAVAAVSSGGRDQLFSFLGLDTTRLYAGVHARAFRYDMEANRWREVNSPGTPRLAGTAQSVRGRIYLFGGYTVAADGSEASMPDVDIFDPETENWSSGAPIPVPADDAVSGVWRDSLIFLISGWHDRDNVANVQLYDPFTDSWRQATPIPGPPAFGHAGAIAGDAIVYIDGVRTAAEQPRFRMARASYIGRIDPTDPTQIAWAELPPHPGPPLYRAAAGALGSRVVFAGGATNPYNYDGIGYDGEPSEPVDIVFAYDVIAGAWESLPAKPLASMDHRGFAVAGGRLFIVGGMLEDRRMTDRVQVLELENGSR